MKVHSFNYFAVIILSLFLSNFAFAEGQRADDSSILDIDASGEVDAMTDGLLMMRSMFGFTDDVLVDGAVAENCTECDSAQIQAHISRVRSATIAQLNSSGEPEPDETEGPFGTFIGIYSEGSITPSGNEAGPEGLFEVASPTTLQNDLEVMGSTTFKGSTTFEGSTTFTLPSSERFYVDGFTEVTDLRVQDSADISNLEASEIIVEDLNVTNYSDLSYLNVDHDAIFAGPATFKSTLEVRGSANISRLDVRDSFAMNASLRWLNVEQTATFAGPATFKSNLDVMGSTNLGSLNVSQNATFAQDVYVANTLTAQELAQESDKRLKKDITPTKYDLKSVLKLNPVDYKLKSNNKDQTGFIAQEVRDVIPELINGIEGDLEKGETLSINYIGLIPVLTKAIQEQQSQIDNQAATIDALLERIIALEKSNNP